MPFELGVPEKAIFVYLLLVLSVILVIGYLLFVQFGFEDVFNVPTWNLLLFSLIVFGFLIYLWDRTISLKLLVKRTAIMFLMVVGWSFFMGFLAFLVKEETHFWTSIGSAFTSLPLFLICMIFVIFYGYLQWKLFTTPLIRSLAVERTETQKIMLTQVGDNQPATQISDREAVEANPFEFHPDPTVSFEELPAFFVRKIKGLLGCVIFDRDEGVPMASALPPGLEPEIIAAFVSSLISEEKNLIAQFSAKLTPRSDTIIYVEQRIIAFSLNHKYPIIFIFDENVPINYIKRVLSGIPEVIKGFLKERPAVLQKGVQ